MEMLSNNPTLVMVGALVLGALLGRALAQISIGKLRRQLSELNNEAYVPLRSSYESLQRDHVYLDEENQKLKAALEDISVKNEKIKQELDGIKSLSDARITEWQSKVTQISADLEGKEEALLDEKKRWGEEKKALLAEIEKKRKELLEIQEKATALEQQRQALEKELDAQKNHSQQAQSDWKSKFDQLSIEFDRLKEQEKELLKRNEELQAQLERFKKEKEEVIQEWQRKYRLLNEEYIEYKKNAEDNRQDWAARYNGLQQEFQNYKFNREGIMSDWEKKFLNLNNEYGDYKKKAEMERLDLVQKYNAALRELNALKQTQSEFSAQAVTDWESKFNALNAEYMAYKRNNANASPTSVSSEEYAGRTNNGFGSMSRTTDWQFKYQQLYSEFETFRKEMEQKLAEKPREIVKEVIRTPNLEELQRMLSQVSMVEVTRNRQNDGGAPSKGGTNATGDNGPSFL